MSIGKQTKDIRTYRRDRLALLSVVCALVDEANGMDEGGAQLYVSVRTVRRAERVIKRVTGAT